MEDTRSDNLSFEWNRGFATGIRSFEDYLLNQLVQDGILNPDYHGGAILDPKSAEKVRQTILKIIRKIMAEQATARWYATKDVKSSSKTYR